MMARQFTFMGRQVEVRHAPVGVILDTADMVTAKVPPMDVAFTTLCASAWWLDTGEPVFRTKDDCRAVSGEYMGTLMAMTRAASEINRPDFGDALAGEAGEAAAAKANGNGANLPSL